MSTATLIVVRGLIAGLPVQQQETIHMLADALRTAREESKANNADGEFCLALALVGSEIEAED